jgi:hypothetical protein
MSSAIALLLAFVAALPAWFAIALKVGIVVGLTGSLIEEIGKRFNRPLVAAFGQQVEAIAVDVPKVVSRVQAYDIPGLVRKVLVLFGKAPLALVLCLALSAPAAGCTNVKPAFTSVQVSQDVTLAYKAAGAALAIADTVNAAYMDSVSSPTQEQVDRSAAATAKLHAIQLELEALKSDFEHGRERLRTIAADLKDARSLLAIAGVSVPSSVDKALEEAARVLQ